MTTEELTTEVVELKRKITELQQQVAGMVRERPVAKGDWLPAMLGRFKDDPEFDKVVEFGRQFRETGELPDTAADGGDA